MHIKNMEAMAEAKKYRAVPGIFMMASAEALAD